MERLLEVQFPVPLRDAELVDPSAPLPPLTPPRPPAPLVVHPSALLAASPPPPPPPEKLWETEIGKQLLEDKQAITTTLARLEAGMRALQEQRQQRIVEWQQAAVELGLTIASRLLHTHITTGGMAIEKVVREAVNRLSPEEPVTIRLHPKDLALLEKRLNGDTLLPDGLRVQVVGDGTLGRGDCHVVGRETSVLSEVRVQLADLRSDLLEKPGHAGSQY